MVIDLAERGTAEFYREQVARIMLVAEGMTDPVARRELFDIAATFQRLADRATGPAPYQEDVSGKQSA